MSKRRWIAGLAFLGWVFCLTGMAHAAPFQVSTQWSSSCGQGTPEEIAATPRPNREAEEMALLLGPGITADPGIYARLEADLARIRALWRPLSNAHFLRIWADPTGLLVQLTPEAHEAALKGKFTEWDCLNDWYLGGVSTVYDIPWAFLEFQGRFHPVRIGADYEDLPGVVSVEPNGIVYPSDDTPRSDVCVAIDGTAYDYYFSDADDLQTWYLRVPQAGAAPILLGRAGTYSGPRPAWWVRFLKCGEDRLQAAWN